MSDGPAARRLAAAAEGAVGAAKALEEGGDASSMAEVRKVLEEVCDAEPEAKTNPAVQAAYVALDNMEAEEVEAIVAQRMAVKEREHQERLVEQFNQFRRFCEDSVSHQLSHLGECAYMS